MIGTPNIHNLYRRFSIVSTALFIAVNSYPNVDAYTKFCLFLNQMIGALLQKDNMPVWDRLVSVFPAWSASIKECVSMRIPLCTDLFPGIASLSFQYNSTQSQSWNYSILWKVVPVQNNISFLGATSGTQICEPPAQGAQFIPCQGYLKAMKYPKGCQHIRSTFPNGDVQWDPVNNDNNLP